MNQSSNLPTSTDWSDLQENMQLLQEACTDSSVPQRYQNVIKQAYRFVSENISQISQTGGQQQVRSASAGVSGQQGQQQGGTTSSGIGSQQQQGQQQGQHGQQSRTS
jgi:uncharacterized protein (UPF0147 family)